MNKLIDILLVIIMLSYIGILAYSLKDSEERTVVRYDCRIAEISPDVPGEVKEACRKRGSNQSVAKPLGSVIEHAWPV